MGPRSLAVSSFSQPFDDTGIHHCVSRRCCLLNRGVPVSRRPAEGPCRSDFPQQLHDGLRSQPESGGILHNCGFGGRGAPTSSDVPSPRSAVRRILTSARRSSWPETRRRSLKKSERASGNAAARPARKNLPPSSRSSFDCVHAVFISSCVFVSLRTFQESSNQLPSNGIQSYERIQGSKRISCPVRPLSQAERASDSPERRNVMLPYLLRIRLMLLVSRRQRPPALRVNITHETL